MGSSNEGREKTQRLNEQKTTPIRLIGGKMNVFVIDVHISKPNCFRNSSTDRVIDEVSLNDEFVMKMFIAVVVKLVMLVSSFNFLRILMRQNTIIINLIGKQIRKKNKGEDRQGSDE